MVAVPFHSEGPPQPHAGHGPPAIHPLHAPAVHYATPASSFSPTSESGRLQMDWPGEARASTMALPQLPHNIAIELIEHLWG